jgi:diketogulonate reductase-like aldo/keto reductase
MTDKQPLLKLNDGIYAPQLGFGVYQIESDKANEAVSNALKAGYRSIDTAAFYKNEKGVGEAVRSSGLPRSDIFVTTKLWNGDQGFDAALKAFDASMDKLKLDYVDLYLIHWPCPAKDLYVDTFKAFIRLRDEGRIKSIGVSNFQPKHLDKLIEETGVVPAVNQIELHPDFAQVDVVGFNKSKGIVTEAWSPLGQGGDLLKNKIIKDVADAHGKTAAQVIIRWHLQLGHMVIPKSETPSRIEENFDVFDFELSGDQLKKINGLDGGNRLGPDPDELN